MSEFNIEVEGGKSVRLPTAGKYCDRDILITATGGGGGNDLLKAVVEGTIEELNDDTITNAKRYAFAYLPSIKEITLSNLVSADTSAFQDCTALETVNLPNLTKAPYTAFARCFALKNVYLPKADGDFGIFTNCTSLEFIDLPKWTYMNASTFAGCTALKVVVLRYTTNVIQLNNVNAFNLTPFRNGEGGTIYVPQAFVESYKTATNWNALESTTFLPIEGSEYE